MKNFVKAWEEVVPIPTYEVGKPEKNPMFLEKRIYQGSSGVVYPHAVIEKICDTKIDKNYRAVFIENEYLKIMILPELGGRIQMAFDKIKNRHFIYYNQVIKPALVGLTGPWVSGGIEFNWPQHHRPSTFDPLSFFIEENTDGSITVWVNEVEKMFRTKGMAGFTLYPGKAYLEVKAKLYNRTPFAQSFLWWANPAVKASDDYQSIFPPDVHAVFDHGRRDVSSFPIATGEYYKVDYSPGTDISRYKNIPVPTSYMAVSSEYNFIGGYEHDSKAGMLHVADHHIVPGKKQWTWGNGEFGKAWDKNLTDEDGPYIELMTGAFTDNQPDFSWMQPYEEKTFEQYFLPYHEIGVVKNATKEAAVDLEIFDHTAEIKLYVTSVYDELAITLSSNNNLLYEEQTSSSPSQPYLKTIVFDKEIDTGALKLTVTDTRTKKILVSYKRAEEKTTIPAIPAPAKAAKKPAETESIEQLYLTGLHLEQYRHATYMPSDYYEEALRRDKTDVRNNNALGLLFLRKGKFVKAEPYFRKAIESLIQRNPNPADGEAYYNLGWCLKMQERTKEAFDAFYKSTWNDAWQHAGFLELGRIACKESNYEEALNFIEKSILKNYHSHTARHLKAVLLRKLERNKECFAFILESLQIDPFNYGCLFEKFLLQEQNSAKEELEIPEELFQLAGNSIDNFIEYSFDYSHAGLYKEASQLLLLVEKKQPGQSPMLYYYLGWFAYQLQQMQNVMSFFSKAASLSPDFCFPNRIEDVPVLKLAMQLNSADAKAPYYLGNFWYDKREYADAIKCWERSTEIDENFPTVYRNLSLAYYNKLHDSVSAIKVMEKAFSLDTSDARVLMELDQLYKNLNHTPEQRLTFLDSHLSLVTSRDDLYLERITLLNQTGEYERALELLLNYKFHPWEGGEGKTIKQFLTAVLELAKQVISKGDGQQALDLLNTTNTYPENLGEGKLYGTRENDINYLKGLAYELLNESEAATAFYLKATAGDHKPVQAIFYNDPQPDKIFYQGLACLVLGEKETAQSIFEKLIEFGKVHLNDTIEIDYFAVSFPDLLIFEADLQIKNQVHCLYMQGLGNLGIGDENINKALKLFDEVLTLDANHQGAQIHKSMTHFYSDKFQTKLFSGAFVK